MFRELKNGVKLECSEDSNGACPLVTESEHAEPEQGGKPPCYLSSTSVASLLPFLLPLYFCFLS